MQPDEVLDVTVEREPSVSITFGDGRQCSFGLEELRRACPCAGCRGARDRGEARGRRHGPPSR